MNELLREHSYEGTRAAACFGGFQLVLVLPNYLSDLHLLCW